MLAGVKCHLDSYFGGEGSVMQFFPSLIHIHSVSFAFSFSWDSLSFWQLSSCRVSGPHLQLTPIYRKEGGEPMGSSPWCWEYIGAGAAAFRGRWLFL